MWSDMLTAAWRTALLWGVALTVFRLMGKRTLGKMGAFDIAVIIMLGDPTVRLHARKMPGLDGDPHRA